jgi:glutathione S-transferase
MMDIALTVSQGSLPALRLHDYVASANCLKVRAVLRQLELPFQRVPVDIFDGDTLTPEYGRMNPARATPVLEVGGRYLSESNAIVVYLSERSSLLPDAALERARALQWLFFEQTEIMGTIGGLRFRLTTGRLTPDDPDARRRLDAAHDALALLEDRLARHAFLVDDRYSIADLAVYAYTHVAPDAGVDLGSFPSVLRWIADVEATPRFHNDLEPYPPNASQLRGRSVYG